MPDSRLLYVTTLGLSLLGLNLFASWWRSERRRRRQARFPSAPPEAELKEPWEAQILGWLSLAMGLGCLHAWRGMDVGFTGYAIEGAMLLGAAWILGRHYLTSVAYDENGLETRVLGRTTRRVEWNQVSAVTYYAGYGLFLAGPKGWITVRENLIDFDAFCSALLQQTTPAQWDQVVAGILPKLARPTQSLSR